MPPPYFRTTFLTKFSGSNLYCQKAYKKVSNKVNSGEFKEDAKKAADKVGETAKNIWGFIKSKVDNVKKD